jgi:hypothetical protein
MADSKTTLMALSILQQEIYTIQRELKRKADNAWHWCFDPSEDDQPHFKQAITYRDTYRALEMMVREVNALINEAAVWVDSEHGTGAHLSY